MMNLDFLFKARIIQHLIQKIKRIRINNPNVSLYVVLILFIRKLQDNELRQRAYAVAFNFTTAIFPAIIFLFTLIPYVPIDHVEDAILNFFDEIGPHAIMNQAKDTVHDIINKPRGGLLSFGFILTLYLATNGMMSLITAFNSTYHKPERRGFWHMQFVATFLTFVLAILIAVAIALLIGGKIVLDYLYVQGFLGDSFIYHLVNILRFVVTIFVFFFAISMIYYMAPCVPLRWKFISVGSVIATTLSVLFSTLFSAYLDNFGTYNKLYGSIGAMLGFMFWLFAISFALLLGFQINATLDEAKEKLNRMTLKKDRLNDSNML